MNAGTIARCATALLAIVTISLFFQACSDDDTVQTGELAPPSNLRAYPRLNGVRLAWNHSSTVHFGNFASYKVTTRDTSQTEISSVSVSRSETTYTVRNLIGGATYFFSLQSVGTSNELTDTISIQATADTEYAIEEFAPPTNVQGLSHDGSVALRWDASIHAGQSFFTGYRIMTRDAGNILVDDTSVAGSILSFTVGNLVNGESYSFNIHSKDDSGRVSKAATLQWGPAVRYSSRRIYEFDSDSIGSRGLQFSTGLTHDFVNGNQQKIDLWIDGSGNTTIFFRPPSEALSPWRGWRTTRYAATSFSSMNEFISIPAVEIFDMDSVSIVLNKLYFAYTQDGHYARILVTGIGGSYPNRYIDVIVSYNSGFGSWAKQ